MEKRSLSSFFVRSKPKDLYNKLQKKNKVVLEEDDKKGEEEEKVVDIIDDSIPIKDDVIILAAEDNSKQKTSEDIIILSDFSDSIDSIDSADHHYHHNHDDNVTIFLPSKPPVNKECQVTLKGDNYLKENVLELYERHCKKVKITCSSDVIFSHKGIRIYKFTKISSLLIDEGEGVGEGEDAPEIIINLFTQLQWNEMELKKSNLFDKLLMNNDDDHHPIIENDSEAGDDHHVINSNIITLSFRFKNDAPIELKVGMMDSLRSISFIILSQINHKGNILFKLDGDIIDNLMESPSSLLLEDGDMIECFLN